jgi:hypothetical protein
MNVIFLGLTPSTDPIKLLSGELRVPVKSISIKWPT